MSPRVPEPDSPRASMTTTSPGRIASNACFWALKPPPWDLNRSSRLGTKRRVFAVPTIFAPGFSAATPSMTTLLSPRERSCADRPAVGASVSLATSSASSPAAAASLSPSGASPAASREPQASTVSASFTAGRSPRASSKSPGPSTTVVVSRPELSSRPLAEAAVTSTSTVSPGATTEDPAGVPVRMTSPGSRVRCWLRSATMRGREKMS